MPLSSRSHLHQHRRSRRDPVLRGIDQVPYLTNSSMMDVDFLPRHLIIVGGSYIGLEFGQMYRRFGSEVTILERGSRLIPREDLDVSEEIKHILTNEGIDIRLNSNCVAFSKEGDEIDVHADCPSSDLKVRGSHVLVAPEDSPTQTTSVSKTPPSSAMNAATFR